MRTVKAKVTLLLSWENIQSTNPFIVQLGVENLKGRFVAEKRDTVKTLDMFVLLYLLTFLSLEISSVLAVIADCMLPCLVFITYPIYPFFF